VSTISIVAGAVLVGAAVTMLLLDRGVIRDRSL
jgi:hypothetical protein